MLKGKGEYVNLFLKESDEGVICKTQILKLERAREEINIELGILWICGNYLNT